MIYDNISFNNNQLCKTMILSKEIDMIRNTQYNKQRINLLIQQINWMNQHNHFVHYQYKIIDKKDSYHFVIKSDCLFTLNEYVKEFGFKKELMNTLIEDICLALDETDGHGHISLNTIYRKNGHFLLGENQFYSIKYYHEIANDKQKDIYDFIQVLDSLIPIECEMLKNSLFFKKGLSKNKEEQYQSTKEVIEYYQMYIKDSFPSIQERNMQILSK